MRFRRSWVGVLAAGMVSSAWAGASLDDLLGQRTDGTNEASRWTNRLIVKYRPGSRGDRDARALVDVHAAAARLGLTTRTLRRTALGAHRLRTDRLMSLDEAEDVARALKETDPTIDYVEVDRRLQPQWAPNDPQYPSQWNYFESTGGIGLTAAWEKATGSGIVVAVVDTGVRPHADLADNLLAGYDFINWTTTANDGDARDADPSDPGDGVDAGECGSGSTAHNSSWHGTHVAGTIAAQTNNGVGVAGVAYGAKLLPVRVLGKCGGYNSDIADAVVWASGGSVAGVPDNATPARVINMSLGGSGPCGATMQAAINGARSRGTVVVVAAGNSNASVSGFSPANCGGVITVAATGRTGGRAYYSNYGSNVDIAAPGGAMRSSMADGILSTLNSGTRGPDADSYAYYQGTSMATPHVAGVVALMLERNPALTPTQVEAKLKATARAFPAACSQCGAGIVNANGAVKAAIVMAERAEIEPNDTPASPQVLGGEPTRVTGKMRSSSDRDHYAITVPAGKTLEAVLAPNASSNYDLAIVRSDGTALATSAQPVGKIDALRYANTSGVDATLVVRVRYVSGAAGDAGGYVLNLFPN